jgi:hypothetical protein
MVGNNSASEGRTTDLDVLLEFTPGEDCCWTAPKWMTEDDILFFYHSLSAKRRIGRLLQDAAVASDEGLQRLLQHAEALADTYAGTILACAQIAGPSRCLPDGEHRRHFKSNVFAPLGCVHVFGVPLAATEFQDIVKIKGQATITLLGHREFEAIRKRLATSNALPDFLANAKFGGLGFRDVNKDNWPAIACSRHARFIHETQLRAYLCDFLLAELKDAGTTVLEECRCIRNQHPTGFADYFVSLDGGWVPIETKRNILTERHLQEQLQKYIHIDSFVPTQGPHRDRQFDVADLRYCVVIDQSGIYLTRDGEFDGCSPGSPSWPREDINHETVRTIRRQLCDWLRGHDRTDTHGGTELPVVPPSTPLSETKEGQKETAVSEPRTSKSRHYRGSFVFDAIPIDVMSAIPDGVIPVATETGPPRAPSPPSKVVRTPRRKATAPAETRPRKMRALSIRQPDAEAIMRGAKTIEYRNRPTHVRERVYIYASLARYGADEEAEMMAEYGIDDRTCDELPRGVLVGTVELYDCDERAWYLRDPERAQELLKPKNHPQPVWFHPF